MYQGDIHEIRTETEIAQDFSPVEAYDSSAPIRWRKKSLSKRPRYALNNSYTRKFDVRDQGNSSTCVGQTHAKLLGIEQFNETGTFEIYSARPIYKERANKPGAGMGFYNAFDIGHKVGTTTEKRVPSQKMTDVQIDSRLQLYPQDKEIMARERGGAYVVVTNNEDRNKQFSIDAIARAIQTTKAGLAFHIFANNDEWQRDEPIIKYDDLTHAQSQVRHAVCAVDFTVINNKKCIIVDESWGRFQGLNGQRILTEKFLSKRLRLAGHYLPLLNEEALQKYAKPTYTFTKNIEWSTTPSDDVYALQDILRYEGLFLLPQSTGIFQNITARAVLAFQIKNGINDFAGETDMRKIRVGAKTRALLNKKYSK